MENSIEINRLIEGQRLTITILIEKNSHGFRDNKPTGMDNDSVFLDFLKEFYTR
jgi:hypothetical protein